MRFLHGIGHISKFISTADLTYACARLNLKPTALDRSRLRTQTLFEPDHLGWLVVKYLPLIIIGMRDVVEAWPVSLRRAAMQRFADVLGAAGDEGVAAFSLEAAPAPFSRCAPLAALRRSRARTRMRRLWRGAMLSSRAAQRGSSRQVSC